MPDVELKQYPPFTIPEGWDLTEDSTPAPRSRMADWGIWRESVERRLAAIEADCARVPFSRVRSVQPGELELP
jgi:hypothetical protein